MTHGDSTNAIPGLTETQPHFNGNGGCDCICDDCLRPETPGDPFNYVCTCAECNGKCDIPHEVG